MGILDRILGTEKKRQPPATPQEPGRLTDEQALSRYRYMLRTAPPETIEQAHAEAFAQLTPEQRRQVLAELANAAPPQERSAAAATSPDDSQALGRLATRTEMRQPGFMERALAGRGAMGGIGGGMGLGVGSSLLASFAMGFAGSMVANSFISAIGGMGGGDAHASGQPDEGGGEGGGDQAIDETQGDVDAGTEMDAGDMDMGDGFGGDGFDV